MNIENSAPPYCYPNLTLVAVSLTRKPCSSIKKNNCLSEHGWDLKKLILRNIQCRSSADMYVISRIICALIGCCGTQLQGGAGGTRWGPGVASAESCTHPTKRDRCFPPPLAERQRLPNVGITQIAKTLESISIRYRSTRKCQIDV